MAKISIPIYLLFSLFLIASSSCNQILLPLTHTLTRTAHTRTPTHELLLSSSLRSVARHRHKNHPPKTQERVSTLPLAAGSDYTLTLSLGRSTVADLYMDTGSDLVWLPCSPFKCILCEGKSPTQLPPPPAPPSNSTPIACSDPSCSAAHSAAAASDLCSIAGCPLEDIETSSCTARRSPCPQFYYAYGDGSLVAGLRRGALSLLPSDLLSVPNFTFACAHSALAEPVGVAGFGRGLLSLPSQLSASRFSYCLVSHSFRQAHLLRPSPLILGRSTPSSNSSSPFIYTPMLHNPKFPYFYSVGLAAVSVGDVKIPTKSNLLKVDVNGNGGMVVDSGTTFTILPSDLHSAVATEFGRKMGQAGFRRAEEVEAETGLRPCYFYSGRNDSRAVPAMGLHFLGNASVALPRRNYFMGFEREEGRRVGCLMVMDGGDEAEAGGGPAGTLGNYQQQGFEVVYDLEEGRVGFARRRCAALWDEMTRGG